MRQALLTIKAGLAMLYARRRTFNAWVVRAVSFYFGYKILHHEIYETRTADPLFIFLGLWLCGVAPATFFDGVRKVGASVSAELSASPEPEPGTIEPKSAGKPADETPGEEPHA